MGLLQGCATTPPAAHLNDADRTDVAHAEAYVDQLHTLRARFMQERNSEVASGQISVRRPGQMRMQYDPPSQAVLNVAAGRVVFSDAATGATSTMPLDRTPLAMLLAPRIRFSGPVTIVSVQHAANDIGITLRSTAKPQQGTLTLQLSCNPLILRGLIMIDARGTTTRLVLHDLQANPPVDG
jgi:outer membrane lipoprotein-sorting protein